MNPVHLLCTFLKLKMEGPTTCTMSILTLLRQLIEVTDTHQHIQKFQVPYFQKNTNVS
jgi:hypothetical protein